MTQKRTVLGVRHSKPCRGEEGLQEDARPLGQIVVEGTGPRVHLEGAREQGLSHGYSDTALFFS